MGANNMNDLVKEKVAMSDKKKSENSHALVEEVRCSFILFKHVYTFEILFKHDSIHYFGAA